MYMRVFRETIFTKLFDITQAKNFESKNKIQHFDKESIS